MAEPKPCKDKRSGKGCGQLIVWFPASKNEETGQVLEWDAKNASDRQPHRCAYMLEKIENNKRKAAVVSLRADEAMSNSQAANSVQSAARSLLMTNEKITSILNNEMTHAEDLRGRLTTIESKVDAILRSISFLRGDKVLETSEDRESFKVPKSGVWSDQELRRQGVRDQVSSNDEDVADESGDIVHHDEGEVANTDEDDDGIATEQ